MSGKINRIKPAVGKTALLFAAALVWITAGATLLSTAYAWLHHTTPHALLFAGIGVVAALLIHHFGFLKIANKNMARIIPMEGKQCLFSFMTWKSYLLVVVMIGLGALLRHSIIPKPYLAIVYIAIGLALILSSVSYIKTMNRSRD
jgi:hypothetical protein